MIRDIVVCGNGAIGLVTAWRLAKDFPDSRIALVGPRGQDWSASLAAGAMVAAIAEVESDSVDFAGFHQAALGLGLQSTESWHSLLAEIEALDAVTADSTVVYLQSGAGEFELANFAAVRRTAEELGRARLLTPPEVSALFSSATNDVELALELDGEFAFDPTVALRVLHQAVLARGVDVIDDRVAEVRDGDSPTVSLHSGMRIHAARVVIAAGSRSRSLLSDSRMQPLLQGVGTALLSREPHTSLMPGLGRRVVRSVNRGGAQCGIHLLPRAQDNVYVGAGNYVTGLGRPETRFETVRYLLEVCERELVGRMKAYAMKGDILLGSRPRSLDGLPLVGPLDEGSSIFVETATNRLGLTWAPELARWVSNWITDPSVSHAPFEWRPSRPPSSFGSTDKCVSYLVASRLGNALEHGLVERNSASEDELRTKLTTDAFSTAESIIAGFPEFEGSLPSPDVWGWLLELREDSPVRSSLKAQVPRTGH